MAVTTTNLGVITAYGDAVAAGYTGTKAEWQALMASYATVGQQAVDAKDDAVAAKNIAVQKADDASTAAGTATQKANEASASAQSIAQSASQITQNTSDISELKEDLNELNGNLTALMFEETLNVESGKSNIFPCAFEAGETYIISTNARQTNLRTLASDKTTTVDSIITEFTANTSVKFIPTTDAPYLRVWGVSNGVITVECTSARVPVLEDTVSGQTTAISNLVGNEDALSISFDDLDNGTMHIPARFVRGTISATDGSAYTEDYLYRIVTPEKIVLDHDVRIYGEENYQVSIAIFNGVGTLVEIANITTGYYTVYSNTPFRVGVRKLTEDTTEVADIEDLYRVPHFGSVINERITALEADRPVFYVGSSREFTTLKAITEYISANNIYNATVYVDAGTYDLTSEYGPEYLDAIPSDSNVGYGLHVGNNTHYIFAKGANVVFDYQGNNVSCADYFSPFNITGSVTLENANIVVNNARYCVHEDLPTSADTIPNNTTVKYINCVMTHNGRTIATSGAHSAYACIGGGCNKNTLSIIDGGKYSNVASTWIYPISYHNYDGTDKSKIVLHNVWMSRGIRLAQLSTHQSIVDVEISGCYMPNGIQKTDNTDALFNVTQWNDIDVEAKIGETNENISRTNDNLYLAQNANSIELDGSVKHCLFTSNDLYVREADYARSTVFELKGNGYYTINVTGGNIRRVAFTNEQYENGVTLHSYISFSGDSYAFKNESNYKYLYVQTNYNLDVAVGVVTVEFENATKILKQYPLTVLPSYILGNAQYKALGVLSRPYICLSADDGRSQLATYTIPMILSKDVPLTMGLWSTSDVLTNAEYLSIVQNAIANGCEVGQHGETPWTLTGPSGTTYKYDEYKLNQFFDAEAEGFSSYGISPKSAIYPYGYTDEISRAVAGGRFKVCRSLYTKSYHGAADYSYYCNGPRSNIFALSGQNIADENIDYWKRAIDYAISHNYLINVFWHDHDLTAEQKTVLEATIDYAKNQNITFVKMSEIPSLI